MKKVLFLGGSSQQIPAIQYAKDKGYYTVVCDYLEDNPGQHYSNEFHCVSITDKNAILKLSKKANIDGIVAFASEPAAATAAYVGNKLKLPSNSYETVLLLSNKNLFREFLMKNGFNYPKSKSSKTIKEAKESLSELNFPLMVKPVDSSGSRGISRIDCEEELEKAFDNSMSESKKKLVIIEEYIEMSHECLIGGDVIVINGKVESFTILNGHRDIANKSYIPFGNSYPTFIENQKIKYVEEEIQKVIDILEIKMGVFNIDIMFAEDEKPYIIEMAARNGGNSMSELLKTITGVDLAQVTVEMALNNKNFNLSSTAEDMYYSTYYIHSFKKGRLKSIIFKDEIKENIIDKEIYKKYGDEVEMYDGLNKVVGIIFLKCSSLEELKYKMKNMNQYIDIEMIN